MGFRSCGIAIAGALALLHLPVTSAQDFGQWCGKYYQVGAPQPNSRPAGSLFPYPELSAQPLLDFRCATASSLYLKGDDANDAPRIIIDTNITHDVGQPYSGSSSSCSSPKLQVDVYAGDAHLASGLVPVNTLGTTLSLNISGLSAKSSAYSLSCRATLGSQTFATNTSLYYMPPNPYGGNTVKVDRSSGGALLVRNETAGEKTWRKIIPFGFYDSYNSTSDPSIYGPDYGTDARADTLRRLHLAKSLGFNLVHPVPPGGYMPYTFDAEATAQFNEYVDTAASLGLYIQYDMRNSFLNLSSVEYQVDYLRGKSNILSWYTGDEPDGADYDLNSTQLAYDLIYQQDGYHPVSLVLNCENYFFIEYALNGADLIMVDPYPIAMNARWSKPYNTYVDENFGDSGCDNCNGTFYDISTRIESTRNRARLQGAWRTKPAWIVPQSFNDGQQEFWYRVPFGQEGEAVTNILAWNHGAQGHASWNSQYSSQELLGNASVIASLLYNQSRFIVDHYDSRQEIFSNLSYPGINGYDLASWTIPAAESSSNKSEILVMAVNQNYGPNDAGPSWAPPFTLAEQLGRVKTVVYGPVSADADGHPVFQLPRTSVAAVILEK